jgi:PAS domain S-box-containing protein
VGGIITPVTLTRFWHRRMVEVTFLIVASIVALYFLPQFTPVIISKSFKIDVITLALAAITAIISLISYFWIPKKSTFIDGLIVFILTAATAGAFIMSTGGTASPFIALWMVVTIFAGLFGVWGTIPTLGAIGVFSAYEYLKGDFKPEVIALIIFAGVLPLVAGIVLWRKRSDATDTSDKAYKNLATELSQVATKSEVVINAIGDGVVALDAQGAIQLINPAAQSIIGWGKQDAMTLSYKSVLHLVDIKGNDLDPTIDPIQQVLNNNQETRTDDYSILTNSGKKLLASLVISPVGEVGAGVIVVFRDVTKEKAEEREQAEFISTASHEMRTPVASIEGYLGLALNPATATIDQKARDFILKAHESAQHLGRLFQDLLDVSKATDGRLSNNPKVVDVMKYTQDILQGLQEKATEKGLSLVFKPIPNDGQRHVAPVYSVYLDNDHIREIINNLTENAIKYTPAGDVTVDVTGTDDKVVVSIKDTGIGIPAEDMPHLFQKFYRVDDPETREIGGTGLGLFLCRRLAETMGGRIWAESEYKKGSTFYLELPRVSNDEAARLIAEAATRAQTEAAAEAAAQPVGGATIEAPALGVAPSTTIDAPVEPAKSVPRGQALTPEQIAAYVQKQKELIQQTQTAAPTPTAAPAQPIVAVPPRPAGVSIPVRDGSPSQ